MVLKMNGWMVAAGLALAAGPARADDIEVSATTLFTSTPVSKVGSGPVVTAAPAYQFLSLSARDVTNPAAEDLRIVISAWGLAALGERTWSSGVDGRLTGDFSAAYVQGRFLRRQLLVRLGREQVSAGSARLLQIDGGELLLVLPGGFQVGGYAGSPVSQRFSTRSGVESWNPAGGDLAYGGRVGWRLPLGGLPGRGLELGAAANVVSDRGEIARQELAADLRLQPSSRSDLALTGSAAYSMWDGRLAEAAGALTWSPAANAHLLADARFTVPALKLARDSILAVFGGGEFAEYGAGLECEVARGWSAGGDYHLRTEPGRTSGTAIGHSASARTAWNDGPSSVGLVASWLDGLENGYRSGRLHGRRALGRPFASLGDLTVAGDVIVHAFREKVNGQSTAVTGSLSAGLALRRGWRVLVAGRAGVTPYMEQSYDLMAKLEYNQLYTVREVRQ